MTHKALKSITYSIKRMSELSEIEFDDWETLRLANPIYSTALLTPEFAKTIAMKRDDVRVVLAKSDTQLVGVFCGHSRPNGLVRPLGAPFDDYSGPIVADGYSIDFNKILEVGGWHSYRASTSVIAENTLVGATLADAGHSYVVNLKDISATEYLALRYKENPKRHKNFRRLSRKLEKDFANIEFRHGPPSDASLKLLYQWKSAQFRRSGLVDILSTSFSKKALDAFIELPYSESTQFGGFSTEIWIDGRFVAGHFGVRAKCDFHPWISAYDPEFSESAPGIVLLYRAIENMDNMGLKTYDLSGGHDHYKKYFALPLRSVSSVVTSRRTVQGCLQIAGFNMWDLLGTKSESSIASRMRRRFDHIAACEPAFGKRMKEVAIAFNKRGKVSVD